MRLFEISKKEEDKKYSKKILPPQYLPSNVKPNIQELFDNQHYTDLMRSINLSNVSEDEKMFLRLAATRHIVFEYSKIADYYAHASKEMQKLMEQSALVIIDINDAIVNGYVKLSKDIKSIIDNNKENTYDE